MFEPCIGAREIAVAGSHREGDGIRAHVSTLDLPGDAARIATPATSSGCGGKALRARWNSGVLGDGGSPGLRVAPLDVPTPRLLARHQHRPSDPIGNQVP